jgi:PhnB protein
MPITPVLFYPNLEPVLPFYLDVLGFTPNWITTDEAGGKPTYADLDFEGSTLMLDTLGDPEVTTPLGAGVVLYVELAGDIDATFERLKRTGVEIVEPLCEQYWGGRVFTINDPAGYALSFYQRKQD